MILSCRSVLVIVSAALIVCAADAQQTNPTGAPNAPSATAAQQSAGQQGATEAEVLKQEESQRILGVVPMFGVTSRQNAAPLTTDQKFHLFVKNALDPFVYVAVGIQAGIAQAQNNFEAYGQGAEGYAKRYGAALADGTASNFFSNFLYPTLLKEDPRYFRFGEGPVKHRIGYALAQEFVCHTDKGGRSFNFSNVLGAVSAGGLSNAYYPPDDRGFGLTMSRAGISLMWGSLGGLISEFWPDIHRKVFEKHPKTGSKP
ncbi:MAG TPA: hypothetical protein VK473_00200 [Terriglobales bacterium]|nr:hypothetical protein [Terriglobales bacterium]